MLCLLPIGLPCLDRLLTDDLSSTFIVGDKGIFRVPLGVGTIPILKQYVFSYHGAQILIPERRPSRIRNVLWNNVDRITPFSRVIVKIE